MDEKEIRNNLVTELNYPRGFTINVMIDDFMEDGKAVLILNSKEYEQMCRRRFEIDK